MGCRVGVAELPQEPRHHARSEERVPLEGRFGCNCCLGSRGGRLELHQSLDLILDRLQSGVSVRQSESQENDKCRSGDLHPLAVPITLVHNCRGLPLLYEGKLKPDLGNRMQSIAGLERSSFIQDIV